jgi:hypothetical protein
VVAAVLATIPMASMKLILRGWVAHRAVGLCGGYASKKEKCEGYFHCTRHSVF